MRAIVCGGRNYNDRQKVFDTLDSLHREHGITEIAQGGASGADTLAKDWCRLNGIPCVTFEAHWKVNGRNAGPIRNVRMLKEFNPDTVIAFPGDIGTRHMVSIGRSARCKVITVQEVIRPPEPPTLFEQAYREGRVKGL